MNKTKLHRGHALKILKWCENKYGYSKYNQGVPSIEFRKERYYDEADQDGYYDDLTNTIFVNRDTHKTVKELIKTIIEEYVHYLQSPSEYQTLAEKYTYYENPYEKEAKSIAKRDQPVCLRDMKILHKIFLTI